MSYILHPPLQRPPLQRSPLQRSPSKRSPLQRSPSKRSNDINPTLPPSSSNNTLPATLISFNYTGIGLDHREAGITTLSLY